MIQNIPDRQSLSYNSFFHLSLRNWMIPARKTNDKLILKLLTSWPCMFSGEWWWGRCHLKQLCWQSHWLSTFKSFHCAALPYAFIICDKYIFIVSTLVWHCRVPCQSLICLEHDIKAHMEVVKISLAICQSRNSTTDLLPTQSMLETMSNLLVGQLAGRRIQVNQQSLMVAAFLSKQDLNCLITLKKSDLMSPTVVWWQTWQTAPHNVSVLPWHWWQQIYILGGKTYVHKVLILRIQS